VETVYKFIPENMSIAVGILSVGSTEPAIYVGGYLLPILKFGVKKAHKKFAWKLEIVEKYTSKTTSWIYPLTVCF